MQQKEFDRRLERLTDHYEYQLALERTRNESINGVWADRFLQLQHLASTGVTTSLIEEKAALLTPPHRQTSLDPEDALNPNQRIELDERKQLFYQDGISLGKSPAEIENRWRDIRDTVIADVRMAVN